MIIATRGHDLELRFAEFGDSSIPSRLGPFATSGLPVTAQITYGLPAAMQAIRQPSMLIAQLELGIFTGQAADRKRIDDAWQAELFRAPDGGTGEMSVYDWWSDMNSSLEGFNNAFARKIRSRGPRLRGRIIALEPLHPEMVWVRMKKGVKTFSIHYEGRRIDDLTTADILHIRGFCVGHGVAAQSPIEAHRNALGVAQALQEFQGRYFANDATPPTIVRFPEGVTRDQAKSWLDMWNSSHRGSTNAGKVGVIGMGADITTLPLKLSDAQFIDSQQFSIEQIARIFNWPAWALDQNEAKESESAERRARNLLTFYLTPRLHRLTEALKADPDLFPDGSLYPEFLTERLISMDALTRAEVDHRDVQSGVKLKDEIRAERGLGPLPDGVGQIPQVIPVGGGPNPDPLPTKKE